MDMLWRRRTALFCMVFVYTGFAAVFLPAAVRWWMAAVAAALFALSFLPAIRALLGKIPAPHAAGVLRIIICTAALALMFFGAYQHLAVDRHTERYDGRGTEITAVVRDRQYVTAYMAAYTADIVTAEGDSFRVLLESPDTSLARGDRITAAVTFSVFEEYSGSFPERRYYYSTGTALRAEAASVTYIGTRGGGIADLFAAWRESLSGMLRADLGRQDSALARALFLGDRSDLPDTLNRDFKRLGISHLLAISGLHFTILLSGLNRILTPLIPSKKKRAVILAAADIGYMLLCGLTETVLRAGLMMLITYAALFFGRRSDTPTALGAASFLICITDPAAFYSVGLQLSVTAVLALIVFSHIKNTFRTDAPLSRGRRIGGQIAEALLLPIVVQIALLPLLCLYFGEVSLITPVSTALLSWPVDAVLGLTPLYLILRVIPPAASILGGVIGFLSASIAEAAEMLASLPAITMSLSNFYAPYFAAALSGAVLTAPLCRNKQSLKRHISGTLGIAVLFFAFAAIHTVSAAGQVKVLSTARGKNDAVIVMTAGDVMLMDVSDGSYAALSQAYSAASKAGATELEALYLTHLHNRHIQSVTRLFDTVYVRSLFLPAPETEAETAVYDALCALAASEEIPLYTYAAADRIAWGSDVEILPAERVWLSRSTHPVIAFSVRANGSEFVYLSASGSEIDALTDQTEADVIVFGGHGPIYKKEIAVSLSAGIGAAVLRGDAADFASDALSVVLTDADVRTGGETVTFVLKP